MLIIARSNLGDSFLVLGMHMFEIGSNHEMQDGSPFQTLASFLGNPTYNFVGSETTKCQQNPRYDFSTCTAHVNEDYYYIAPT